MTPSSNRDVRLAKRRKIDDLSGGEASPASATSTSLNRSVSPPSSRRKTPLQITTTGSLLSPAPAWGFDDVPKQTITSPPSEPPWQANTIDESAISSSEVPEPETGTQAVVPKARYLRSPFQLTKIRDLAPHQNVDTVNLKDILGNPLIRECWNFNFLFDLDFVMQHLDEDVRDLVNVKIVHGFWQRDSERRIALMEAAERYSNIELINAYLPDPFGTHHSKMLILFRHDDCAQIVIHTANMISKDWTNMTQAVWRSPFLPLATDSADSADSPRKCAIGSGNRFKVDLLRYLSNYEHRLRRLTDQLALYEFSAVRAAFLGSAPSRQVVRMADPTTQTSFGWLGLQQILSSIRSSDSKSIKKAAHIVLQLSSIATLGATPTWLSHFQTVLARSNTPWHPALSSKPRFNIIFPTAEEVRTSLDGYESGGSIHMKVQSAQQQKQLQYLHPLLCHWKYTSPLTAMASQSTRREAHRGPAAPHIKTYIRFSDETHESVDWALLTSANLSKQAWGDVINKQGEVRIQSYETGVLVWPDLFAEPGADVRMVPTFGQDTPSLADCLANTALQKPNGDEAKTDVEEDDDETKDENEDDVETEDEVERVHDQSSAGLDKGKGKGVVQDNRDRITVGLRIPYDLPLSSYSTQDKPWCATQQYTEPDWKGRAWGGFRPR